MDVGNGERGRRSPVHTEGHWSDNSLNSFPSQVFLPRDENDN